MPKEQEDGSHCLQYPKLILVVVQTHLIYLESYHLGSDLLEEFKKLREWSLENLLTKIKINYITKNGRYKRIYWLRGQNSLLRSLFWSIFSLTLYLKQTMLLIFHYRPMMHQYKYSDWDEYRKWAMTPNSPNPGYWYGYGEYHSK